MTNYKKYHHFAWQGYQNLLRFTRNLKIKIDIFFINFLQSFEKCKLKNSICKKNNKGKEMFLTTSALGTIICQTTYFLLFAQLLCFGFLFGKYTKLREIFLCLCLIFAQLFLIDFGYSRFGTPTLNALNYICLALSVCAFGYVMRLLYIVAKAKSAAKNDAKDSVEYYPKDFTRNFIKDFNGIVIIVAILFVVVAAKMVCDFV